MERSLELTPAEAGYLKFLSDEVNRTRLQVHGLIRWEKIGVGICDGWLITPTGRAYLDRYEEEMAARRKSWIKTSEGTHDPMGGEETP